MKHSGFSLIELAIVMVVVGLIIGGVVVGQGMIRSSSLASLIAEEKMYQTAVAKFMEKYESYPGDMFDAEDYWDDATNGDGDQTIELDYGAAAGAHQEVFEFWLQLGASGMISGEYSANAGPSSLWEAVEGENVPYSPLKGGMFAVRYIGTPTYVGYFNTFVGNHLTFGALDSNKWPEGYVLLSEEAYSIDYKIDDGKPAYGRVMASHHATCTLAADRNDLSDDYDLSQDDKVCGLRFVIEE